MARNGNWTCPACGRLNPYDRKRCVQCNARRIEPPTHDTPRTVTLNRSDRLLLASGLFQMLLLADGENEQEIVAEHAGELADKLGVAGEMKEIARSYRRRIEEIAESN